MDFRNRITRDQVERAKRLAVRGLLHYQPFIFDDSLAVGAGLSIVGGWRADPPMMDFHGADRYASPDFLQRFVASDDEQRAKLHEANAHMRAFYDGLVDDVVTAVGGVRGKTVLDVGCNAGYFSIALALRGARVTSLDREPYEDSIALLNEICGTSVEFRRWEYNGAVHATTQQYDLVLSIAVLVHLSEPLHHLAWLGSATRDALFVYTHAHVEAEPDRLAIHFHSVNRYYTTEWPFCFDTVSPSKPLLRLGFEKMGFSAIREVPHREGTMPSWWGNVHLGLLGQRNRRDATAGA